MAFDCSQCVAACRADCCHGPVPFEKTFVASHVPIRPIAHRTELGDNMEIVLAIDERYPDGKHGVCPFLGLDDKCSVYADRPFVCRKFGDGTSPFMTCSFQAPDGRVRSRQERRHIERVQFKKQNAIVERWRNGTSTDEDDEVGRKVARDWPDDDPAKKRAIETGKVY